MVKLTALVLVPALALAGCIHTQSHETSQVKGRDADLAGAETFAQGPLRASGVIYAAGTTPDKTLAELVDAGYLPVYVRVRNAGAAPAALGEDAFALDDGQTAYGAIPADELPREFQHLNPAAVGANVYNTGVVVVTVAAVMALVLVAAASHGGGGNLLPGAKGGSGAGVWNDTTKTTTLDYKGYLLAGAPLAPGAEAAGLVFFRVPAGVEAAALRLRFAEQ